MSMAILTVLLARYRPMSEKTERDYGPGPASAWRDIDWRAHQKWVIAEGYPVNVIDVGEGPAIVWVHGLGGAWQNWLEQLPDFATEHRCVALDLPGFGASPDTEVQISIPGYGQVVQDVCSELGIDRAVLVGNSMGGFVACEVAVQFPELVERLVLVSSAGLSSEQLRRRPMLTGARMGSLLASWVGTKSDALARRRRARALLTAGIFHHPERIPAPLMSEQLRGTGKPGFIEAFDALMTYRLRDRLGEITVPTLVVWGRSDRLVPVRDSEEFERLIPHARRVVFDSTGHVPQLERPAAFNAALRDFLAEEAREPEAAAR
jgi:4,5:9,10-diseco-3-hydroxy-5,9,17-trioxoandrosta-1(10),2-diene-4-oate hydrolase